MSVLVLVGADIVPTKSNLKEFENGDELSLVGDELLEVLRSADYIIMNLEVPLADVNTVTPIKKFGPNLIAPKETINGLSKINPCFFTLANNHIMDYGAKGMYSTIDVLDSFNIEYAGVGDNIKKVKCTFIKTINNIKIGIFCCAEHEFSIATELMPGVNPYDPLISFDEVAKLKKESNYVIVLYHGGKENFRYPTPELQRVFRKFAEAGADIVIAQHTHCIGCMENYQGSLLVYGQGNFLFDSESAQKNDLWMTSMLIRIKIDEDIQNVDFLPLKKEGSVVRLADKDDKAKINREFRMRNMEIQNDGFIRDTFDALVNKQTISYLKGLSAGLMKNMPFKLLNRLTHDRILKKIYAYHNILAMENYVNCETHREMIQRIIEIEKQNEK